MFCPHIAQISHELHVYVRELFLIKRAQPHFLLLGLRNIILVRKILDLVIIYMPHVWFSHDLPRLLDFSRILQWLPNSYSGSGLKLRKKSEEKRWKIIEFSEKSSFQMPAFWLGFHQKRWHLLWTIFNEKQILFQWKILYFHTK